MEDIVAQLYLDAAITGLVAMVLVLAAAWVIGRFGPEMQYPREPRRIDRDKRIAREAAAWSDKYV